MLLKMFKMLWKAVQAVVTLAVLAVLVIGVVAVYEVSTAPVGANAQSPNAMSPKTAATVRQMMEDSADTLAEVDRLRQATQTNAQYWASTSCLYSWVGLWRGLEAYHATFDPTVDGVKVEAIKIGKAVVLLLAAQALRELVEDQYLNEGPLFCGQFPSDS